MQSWPFLNRSDLAQIFTSFLTFATDHKNAHKIDIFFSLSCLQLQNAILAVFQWAVAVGLANLPWFLQTSNQCYNGPTNVSMDSIQVAKTQVLNSIEHEWGNCSTGYKFGKIAVDELNLWQQHYFMIIEN